MTENSETQQNATRLIDDKIMELDNWRASTLSKVRALIRQAVPDIVEEVKWKKPSNPNGVPTWSHNGIICTGETYKDKVKLTFMKGAQLRDDNGLFNAGLGGNSRRAIDLLEGDEVPAESFIQLIQEAAELNSN